MPNQKGFAPVLIVLILAAVALGSGYLFFANQNKSSKEIACTADAKICPDGTAVGRTGPNCEFAQCPTPKESTSSADPKDMLKKTFIDTKNSGKYTNEEYGYTVEFPIGWELYTYDSNHIGNVVQLYHPKCKGEEYISPENTKSCTNMTLPYYVGSTGWGYGNKKQTEETVFIKNNIKANKTTFYYDDNILISWIFNIDIPDKCERLGISALVAFADINEEYVPGSLQAVDSIIKSLEFILLKDSACQ